MSEPITPEGYHSVTPYLAIRGREDLLAFVRAAFDAEPYGDRVGAVSDPAGNQWWIATRKETLTSEEIAARMSEGPEDSSSPAEDPRVPEVDLEAEDT